MSSLNFYSCKKVLITGNTGFKGTWMSKVLTNLGATVIGYALKPVDEINLFDITGIEKEIKFIEGDIRDLEHLITVFKEEKPEIVIHMAAQPLVRESYQNPVYTYETNVIGTVNVCEAVRMTPSVRSFLNVTTDKVYLNKEWIWPYRENEELNGFDPYSNSKSCSELVTSCYKNSFFTDVEYKKYGVDAPAVSTCRAGNVIGGGDFACDRIIPDCIRAVTNKKDIIVRNPNSIRPYQHVLEPVIAYLMIAQAQYNERDISDSYNVGPNESDSCTTGELVQLFCNKWNSEVKSQELKARWINKNDGGPHEASYLKLDCSKIHSIIGWRPLWDVETAIDKIVEWTLAYMNKENIIEIMNKQIEEYLLEMK